MPDRRRSRTLLAVLTLVALVLITVDYREGENGPISAAQRGALIVFAPLQDGFAQVVQPVAGLVGAVGDIGSLRAENARLEAELAELEGAMPSVTDLERENEELRDQLGMRERYELDTVAASVIGQPPGEQGHSVIVDIGADRGIESGMPVVATRGLVGKVTEVTDAYSRVELLTSPTARYAVRVADSGETGLLRGQGAQPFLLELLDPEAEAPEGSEVVTRTFEASTIPDGLPVGEVAVSDDTGTPSPRFFQVRPFVDFRGLSTVQVVLDAETAPARFDPDDIVDEPDRDPPPRPSVDEDDDEEDDGDEDGEDDEESEDEENEDENGDGDGSG